jgi:Radical SAM superfamily
LASTIVANISLVARTAIKAVAQQIPPIRRLIGQRDDLSREVQRLRGELLSVRCQSNAALPVKEKPNDVQLDLLSSPITRTFHLELTNNCNLRCLYCAVSQPGYEGQDMDVTDFDDLVQMLKARRVKTLVVNGHGETTMIPGWHHRIIKLADAGFRMSIITNFARLLKDDELVAMTRIGEIQVSIDTHRQEILRAVRRRVDLGNVLISMKRVTATASILGLPKPAFSWSCVVTDQVALGLLDYVHFGLACDVRHFTLCNLTKYDDIEGAQNIRHVTTLPDEELKRVSKLIGDCEKTIRAADGSLSIQAGLTDSIRDELRRRH